MHLQSSTLLNGYELLSIVSRIGASLACEEYLGLAKEWTVLAAYLQAPPGLYLDIVGGEAGQGGQGTEHQPPSGHNPDPREARGGSIQKEGEVKDHNSLQIECPGPGAPVTGKRRDSIMRTVS